MCSVSVKDLTYAEGFGLRSVRLISYVLYPFAVSSVFPMDLLCFRPVPDDSSMSLFSSWVFPMFPIPSLLHVLGQFLVFSLFMSATSLSKWCLCSWLYVFCGCPLFFSSTPLSRSTHLFVPRFFCLVFFSAYALHHPWACLPCVCDFLGVPLSTWLTLEAAIWVDSPPSGALLKMGQA